MALLLEFLAPQMVLGMALGVVTAFQMDVDEVVFWIFVGEVVFWMVMDVEVWQIAVAFGQLQGLQ